MSTQYSIRHEHFASSPVTSAFSVTTGGINAPRLPNITFTGVDSTHVRATFEVAVVDNPAVRCVDLWFLTNGEDIDILAVTPEQTPDVDSVLLTTSEHLNASTYAGTLYTLDIAQ